MKINDFIREHLNDSTDKLLLSADKYKDIDVRYAVEQIIARRNIQEKLPFWFTNFELIFPSQLSTEQASSETTARYKQQLIRGSSLCDMTGGLGIDSYFLSQKVDRLLYIERFTEYANCAKHNFMILDAKNIEVINGDSITLIAEQQFDTIYIDPARRGTGNKRLFALDECEPNIIELVPQLLQRSQRVIVKISPMADLSESMRMLPAINEIHILSVKNECKELLLISDKNPPTSDVKIVTINFTSQKEQYFDFFLQQENTSHPHYSSHIDAYLYEPNSSILKAGAFKVISEAYSLAKLHPHSHLYSSDRLISDFPGRTFRVDWIVEASSKNFKKLVTLIPQANITVRNFPISVAEIRKKTKIKEGGNYYVFATTFNDNKRYFVICSKIEV